MVVPHASGLGDLSTEFCREPQGWEKLPATLRAQLTNATLAGLATFPADWPELEWIIFDGPFGVVPGASPGLNYVTAIVALVAPLSRGNVTIASADTTDNPVINPNFLLDPRDQEIALQAVRRVRQLGDTSAVQSVLYSERVPGQNITTDAQLLEWLKNQALPIYHPSTTCESFFRSYFLGEGRGEKTDAIDLPPFVLLVPHSRKRF